MTQTLTILNNQPLSSNSSWVTQYVLSQPASSAGGMIIQQITFTNNTPTVKPLMGMDGGQTYFAQPGQTEKKRGQS